MHFNITRIFFHSNFRTLYTINFFPCTATKKFVIFFCVAAVSFYTIFSWRALAPVYPFGVNFQLFTSHRMQYFLVVIAKAIGQANRRSFNSARQLCWKNVCILCILFSHFSRIQFNSLWPEHCVLCYVVCVFFFFCECSRRGRGRRRRRRCVRCICECVVLGASLRTLSRTIRLCVFRFCCGPLLLYNPPPICVCVRCVRVYYCVVYIFIWPCVCVCVNGSAKCIRIRVYTLYMQHNVWVFQSQRSYWCRKICVTVQVFVWATIGYTRTIAYRHTDTYLETHSVMVTYTRGYIHDTATCVYNFSVLCEKCTDLCSGYRRL